jgi:hypothetical protein
MRTSSSEANGFRPGKRLLLFGAGATRGASFGYPPECLPPLNRDFFTQLQRITHKHNRLVQRVVEDVIELFDSNFDLTLEEYFTQLEFLTSTATLSAGSSSSMARDLQQKRDRLMEALSAVLETSTYRAISSVGRGCEYHQRIVESLRARDVLISFNYDCVLDDALRRAGAGKWVAGHGYAFPPRRVVMNSAYWDGRNPPSSAAESIYLLKLHGSLNWQLPGSEGGDIYVKQRLHQQYGTPRFTIIPPEWNKRAREEPIFNLLWRRAFKAIQQAEQIAIVGFSFTPTDLHVESLFRVALASSRRKVLVIANPSSDDRARVRRVFARALAKNKTIIRQYESLSDMVAAWPECFS